MFENPEQAFGGTTQLLGLIELIYSAVSDATLWPSILDKMDEAVNGQQTLFFAALSDPAVPEVLCSIRTSPELAKDYLDHFASVNVLAEPCDRMFPEGSVRYSHWAISDAEFERSEFYCDFFRCHNAHYSLGLKVPLGDLPTAYLSCQRSKSKGPFAEREGLVYQTLKPHLQRALRLYSQLTTTESSVLGLERALDSFEHAVFGLNRKGKVILHNRRAEAIVRAGDAIRLSGGRLWSILPGQNRRLQACLAEAVGTGTSIGISPGTSLLIDRKSGENPLRVTVMPVPSSLPGSSAQLSALVFVSDPTGRPQSRAARLRALYALTPAEARVADQLLQGQEMQEVANGLGLTLETARFHTKRVLSKTGTRRQTELMRLMLALPSADNGVLD
jgi:DNA-binding CsgD family transcriptional regulator/PAS domain-containing protein